MLSIGDADAHRMESYTCAPTVTHIVRILQASKENPEKYKTVSPGEYCNDKIMWLEPFCSIGKFGYTLSILEQMGYIYRFYMTYCIEKQGHFDIEKCNKKMKKYMERYSDAFTNFNKIKEDEENEKKKKTPGGGKSKKTKRRRHRKTRRIKKNTKNKKNRIKRKM
jgi:hypothetical protein